MSKYRVLFSVQARHEFFADGLCRGLAFTPTSQTAALFRNRQLLHRATSSELCVVCDAEATPLEGAAAHEPLTFAFTIAARDPGFWSYTEPVLKRKDTAGIAMQPKDAVVVFDSDLATTSRGAASMSMVPDEWPAPADPAEWARSKLCALLRHPSLPCAAGTGPTGEVLSSTDFTEAGYRLAPPLAVVAIRMRAGDLQGNAPPRPYHIAFEARRTRWKYYVLGASGTDAPLGIRDLDGAMAFKSGAEGLADGRQALTLLSNSRIALHERPSQRFQLRANSPGDGRVLVKRLPVASPHQFGKHPPVKHSDRATQITVSEIYINL
jgi:hypothetical protein